MGRFLKISLAAAALGSGSIALAGSAPAAVVSGSDLSMPPAGNSLCPAPMKSTPISCTTAISFLPVETRASGGYRAGIDGVIVAWTVRTGNSAIEHFVRLRLIRGTTGAGSGGVETLPKAQGTYTYAARLPVEEGDLIGIDTLKNPELQGTPIIRTFDESTFDFWNPTLLDGETRAPTSNESPDIELLINATIEPDADKDGYGDETQDKCPGQADPTNACPAPSGGGGSGGTGGGGGKPIPTEAVPDTKISKVALDGAKVTFRFTSTVKGARFQCKLDKKPWKTCKSPKVYNGLKGGRHSFKVKAVGPTAVPDPTPAKRSFKVEL